MTRDEFMKELAYLLQDIESEDKEDAVQYYTDYFDEAGPDKEAEIIKELGSPERIASMIRSDISGHMKDGGAFTERGYEDERFRDPGYGMAPPMDLPEYQAEAGQDQADKGRDTQPSAPRSSKVVKTILWIVLILAASPILLGIGGGLLGLLFGALGILTAMLVTLGVLTFAALLGGVILVPFGVVQMFAHPLDGLMSSGTGLIFLGAGALCLALSILFYGRFVPFIIRGIVNSLSRLLHGRR